MNDPKARYQVYNRLTGEVVHESKPWPRADDQPIEGLDANLVWLRIEVEPQPAYDARRQRLVSTWQRDLEAGIARLTHAVEDVEGAVKTWPDAQAFTSEFGMPELAQISLSTDPTIAALRFVLSTWRGPVHADDARVLAGLNALVAAGILTQARKDAILSF